jgi:hypothetical protein
MNSLHLKSHIECLQASTNIPQATFDCAINPFPSVCTCAVNQQATTSTSTVPFNLDDDRTLDCDRPNLSPVHSWSFNAMTRTTRSMARTAATATLRDTINQNQFYSLTDAVILRQIHDAFEPELERLKGAYSMREPGSPTMCSSGSPWNAKQTPSELLYGRNHDEVNRTLVGVLALRWIINNDYDTFVGCQPAPVRLLRESFDWLRNLFEKGITTPDDLFALVTAMIINDLGKDANLEEDYFTQTGESVQGMNHDMVLFEAAKAGMVPSLDRLSQPYRDDVMLGLELGSELNAGQLAQAENVIGSLEGLLLMRGHERAFELKFMEQLLDVAGAAGHSDATCAKKMIEPVFRGFQTVYEVALDIISGRSDLREGYDKVLEGRGNMLQQKGFRGLSVKNPEERALLRLLTMGRTADKEQAELFYETFYSLSPLIREELVNGLNVDGYNDGKAILPYYMPAMLSEGLENTKTPSESLKQAALSSLMRFLARVLEGTKPDPGADGVVIERNLMYARDTIASEQFREDPSVLDKIPIPKGEVVKRRASTSTAPIEKEAPPNQGGRDGALQQLSRDPLLRHNSKDWLLRQNSIQEEQEDAR